MERMKETTLTRRLMTRFVICMAILMVQAIPLLYLITTNYYVEDLAELVRQYEITNPDIDLERDTIEGLLIQFFAIIAIILIAVLVIMRYVPQRLWRPFNYTLREIKTFKVESGQVPQLSHSGTKEFDELNDTLTELMTASVRSYKVQKEFTENASHELQTPIAVVQSKLDNLLQDSELTERQNREIQQIYQELCRMSRLSRNLLLLSKIENNQYAAMTNIDLCDKIRAVIPQMETLAPGMDVVIELSDTSLTLHCNEPLLESMITNLAVNAIRHNSPITYKTGQRVSFVKIIVNDDRLTVANTSTDPALDQNHVFSRFYRTKSQKGNGLGLAIVKSICNYHHWTIAYSFHNGIHEFLVKFNVQHRPLSS